MSKHKHSSDCVTDGERIGIGEDCEFFKAVCKQTGATVFEWLGEGEVYNAEEITMSGKKLEDKDVTPQIALGFINNGIEEARQIGLDMTRVMDGNGNHGVTFGAGVRWDGWRLVMADEVSE